MPSDSERHNRKLLQSVAIPIKEQRWAASPGSFNARQHTDNELLTLNLQSTTPTTAARVIDAPSLVGPGTIRQQAAENLKRLSVELLPTTKGDLAQTEGFGKHDFVKPVVDAVKGRAKKKAKK